MPIKTQSDLPIPKSWDEFEDIVLDLYKRVWQDLNTTRNARSGQRQNGVDIYGKPIKLEGVFAGIQCKRYDDNRLSEKEIKEIVKEAEIFKPELAEFYIATTEHRDGNLQEIVRKYSLERESKGLFPVYIVFWEELCNTLTNPQNDDLFIKYYPDWIETFSRKNIVPNLRLMLFCHNIQDLHECISFSQYSESPQIYPKEYRFGIALENLEESSNAQGIDICLNISWEGQAPENVIEIKPWISYAGWTSPNRSLTSNDPIILEFRGGDHDRCPYGQPLKWDIFHILVNENIYGSFKIHYRINSIVPQVSFKDVVRILME